MLPKSVRNRPSAGDWHDVNSRRQMQHRHIRFSQRPGTIQWLRITQIRITTAAMRVIVIDNASEPITGWDPNERELS
jgi:uncharacterized membrane protein